MASNTDNVPEISNQTGINEDGNQIQSDIEEGELPEEGEIMDDDEEDKTNQTENQAPYQKKNVIENVTRPKPVPLLSLDTTSRYLIDNQYDYYTKGFRKRTSPIEDDESNRTGSPVHLAPKRKQPWTEGVLCKFFREGYCRDGINCAYSHDAAHSNRKPELCKFYQQGFCKKGLACTLLHGEYPCKAFHEGKCDKNPCKYSHMPLNDYTKTIFEQMVQDEALAAQIVIPQVPAKRRVLLPRPSLGATPSTSTQTFNSNKSPLQTPSHVDDQVLTAPTNQLPDTSLHSESTQVTADTDQVFEDPDERMVIEEESKEIEEKTEESNQNGFSFGAMLEEMTNTTKKPLLSIPPSITTVGTTPTTIPGETWRDTSTINETSPHFSNQSTPIFIHSTDKKRLYKIVPIEEYDPDYDIEFLQKIASDKFQDDPRVQSFMKKQFDRTSSLFGQIPPPVTSTSSSDQSIPVAKTEKAAVIRDPRVRPSDPRQRTLESPSQIQQSQNVPQIIATNFDVHSGIPLPVTALNDADIKTLAEKQLQMINVQAQQQESSYILNDAGYSDEPQGSYRSPRRYNDYDNRRDYLSGPRYDRGFDRNYEDYNSYDERGRGSSRGRGRGGYYDSERRDYRNNRFNERGYENRGDSHRRDSQRGDRDRKDYLRTSGRFRERSRSPRNSKPESDMSIREKRKNTEYQSPLARA